MVNNIKPIYGVTMNGKFYILNQPFCLRGYDKLPYALLHRPENSILFVNKDTFWALSLCDGKTDCSLPIFPEKGAEYRAGACEKRHCK